ncbi:peptidase, S54 family [Bacteriovorax sp. BSW11_IV]|uniref:rhomboid family intramembrane serine protease n=1 Tax=Bacteriovorax sp. BSW11_IV TaxID=1353529 RepID=UPI00038A3889|nr:rhomboid family intramembrane serine protease [Bacteriovorax sp. BSW11_IV]EQC48680.1 peptidase, S54 family [Bacteriovorax sp. BSW11_IV]
MFFELRFKENYLSNAHYKNAFYMAFAILTLSYFLSYEYWMNLFGFSSLLNANGENVMNANQWWRLITSAFIHGDLGHFLSNSFMLGILSFYVQSFYGPVVLIITTILSAASINYIVLQTMSEHISLVGMSGVVYFMWGFWLILYFFIERHVSKIRRLMKISMITFVLLIPTNYSPNTSYLAHGVGLLLGLGSGGIYYLFKKKEFISYEKFEYELLYDYTNEESEQLFF